MDTDSGTVEARWPEVSALLDRLLEIPVDQRSAFMDREIGDDAELRELVDRLLEVEARSGQFLGPSAQRLASSLLENTPEAVAHRLGRYEILGQLGSGGMGQVFEAEDRRLRRKVAIKVLAASHALNEKGRKRFLREARAASSIDHPNICTVHDIGETDGHLYIVMSRYDGETLESRLGRGRLAPHDAMAITSQVARGLVRAHAAGVIHRDIKPANIVLTHDGQVKILDFGIAKVMGETQLTRTDMTPGTLAYMAPELIEGGEADARSDLWSLGVLLYQMLTGRLPFDRGGAGATVHAIVHQGTPPIDEVALPPGLTAVLDRTLAKSPAARFPDAQALLAALDRARQEEWDDAAAGSIAPLVSAPSGRRAAWTTLAVAAVVLGLVAVAWWRGREPRPQDAGPSGPIVVETFADHTADPAWAWLGQAIASMLSCDLAQVDDLIVVGGGCGLPTPAADRVPDVADTLDPGARRIRGSYLASGDRLRVDVKVVTADGEISNKVLQCGRDDVLDLVADASAFVRLRLDLPADGGTWLANEAMTTTSLDAWRHHQAGLEAYLQGDEPAAIAAFERAIAEDPEFAVALADLGLLHANASNDLAARRYFERARSQSHRLPVDLEERVQAELLATTWEGYGAAVDVLERLVERDPQRQPTRNHLAAVYGWLEDYEAAARLYQTLIDEGTGYFGSYESAVSVNVALGRFDRAQAILDTVPADVAVHWKLQWKRGWLALEQGDHARARALLTEVASLPAARFLSHYDLWRLALLEEDWPAAHAWAQAIIDGAVQDGRVVAYEAWWGYVALARTHLVVGRASAALDAYARAAETVGETPLAALALCLAGDVQLALGQPERSLEHARRAQGLGDQQWPWLQAKALEAQVLQALGRQAEADDVLDGLAHRALNAGNRPELRLSATARGRVASRRGEHEQAVANLRQAVEQLPTRGIEFHAHRLPDHVTLVEALGRAELRAEHLAEAETLLDRVLTSGTERVHAPMAWVRAHALRATLHRRAGDVEAARDLYRRFLALRADSPLDVDLVAEARAALTDL